MSLIILRWTAVTIFPSEEKKSLREMSQVEGSMGAETKKEAADGKDFKPFLTAQDVKAALEQRHVDLLSQSKH